MRFLVCVIPMFLTLSVCAQQADGLMTIGFYNVENLFDTIDAPLIKDEDYTPNGRYRYRREDYNQKLKNHSEVITDMAESLAPFSLLGLAELENETVLKDLISMLQKKGQDYSYIHYDSPDRRGIDVALLYNPMQFQPHDHKANTLRIWDEQGIKIPTRDILVVTGALNGHQVAVIVNHWPSRRGGKKRSASKRWKAAFQVMKTMKQLVSEHSSIGVIIMGDFNDDPIDKSILKELVLKSHLDLPEEYQLFNPMQPLYLRGYNSMVYRDQLHLFDQIIFSRNLIDEKNGFKLIKAGVFNPPYVRIHAGRYRGYPFRSYDHNGFNGGYSDHYPVYLILASN